MTSISADGAVISGILSAIPRSAFKTPSYTNQILQQKMIDDDIKFLQNQASNIQKHSMGKQYQAELSELKVFRAKFIELTYDDYATEDVTQFTHTQVLAQIDELVKAVETKLSLQKK